MLAAIYLGMAVAAIVPMVYLPLMIANACGVGNGLNSFADTLHYGGGVP